MDKIEITGVNLVEFAQTVYELSVPRGMGFLHVVSGGLSKEDAESLLMDDERIALSMDYVRGRGCKMNVFKDKEKRLFIHWPWYDHTDEDMKTLLTRFDIQMPKQEKHGPACACPSCETDRKAAGIN